MGFAVLMFGMSTMSAAVSPLREDPTFIRILTSFSNPFLGILFGTLFTCVLQSASAAVGILQALASTGIIDFSIALPIIMGIAIGAAMPVLLSAIGASVDGKRTAMVYLVAEVTGVILFAAIYYTLDALIRFPFADRIMTSVSVRLSIRCSVSSRSSRCCRLQSRSKRPSTSWCATSRSRRRSSRRPCGLKNASSSIPRSPSSRAA